MALTRYDPLDLLRLFNDQFGSLMDRSTLPGRDELSSIVTGNWVPAVDIKEEPDRFVIHADVPGVKPEDIEVTMENGLLTLRGSRQEEKKEEREGYRRVERSSGSFYRRFSLPDSARGDNVAATCKDGVLEVVVPKAEQQKARKIVVSG